MMKLFPNPAGYDAAETLVKSGLVESMKKDKATYYFVNAGLVYKYVDTVKKL